MIQIPENLEKYIVDHSDRESDLLYELFRETHKKVLHPRMLSGHLQGKLLEMLTKMIQPQRVLEIGTYTGYSAICIARGLNENGILHTIEINDELEDFIQHYFERSGYKNKIKLHIGNAINIIKKFSETFDLIFIDGDKREYPDYLASCKKILNKGGFIIADNVFWGGKVLNDSPKTDPHTNAIKKFNGQIQDDPELENLMLPIRDGLMIVRKK
jgi:predicted O-methyltransferase YrrM